MDIYDTSITRVEEDIPKIQAQVTNLAPVSTDADEVEKQLLETSDIQDALNDDKVCLENAIDASDWLIENANAEPSTENNMKDRINKNKEPLEELSSVVNERQNALKCGLVQSQEFKSASEDFLVWMKGMEEKLTGAKPVMSDVDIIRELKREHKVSEACLLLLLGGESHHCSDL